MKEYAVIVVSKVSKSKIERQVNEMAMQGWVLKCTSMYLCFFERDKNQNKLFYNSIKAKDLGYSDIITEIEEIFE